MSSHYVGNIYVQTNDTTIKSANIYFEFKQKKVITWFKFTL